MEQADLNPCAHFSWSECPTLNTVSLSSGAPTHFPILQTQYLFWDNTVQNNTGNWVFIVFVILAIAQILYFKI